MVYVIYTFRYPVQPLPFHIELGQYFHPMLDIYRRADAQPGDYSTSFGLSGIPYYSIHLALQRAHDDVIAPTCSATLMPVALQPYVREDMLAQYDLLSQDPRFSHLNFPALGFGQEIPVDLAQVIHDYLLAEHEAFIHHL